MGRIQIATASQDSRVLGRSLMSDHNVSARLWASAALVAVPLESATGLAWWLPLHLALLGAASQAIVGGQLMFSATLGLARGPSRRMTLTQLGLLNLAAILVIGGRLWESRGSFGVGASIFMLVIGWVTWQVDRLWRRSVNRRFTFTGTFYRLAGVSVILGATIGAALGVGAFDDAASYLEHRTVHMALNILGWAGLTVVGTATTLLPTILHVRAPKLHGLRYVPWLMFGGLALVAGGATIGSRWTAMAGMVSYSAGLAAFGVYMRRVLSISRRRKVPTAALHLVGALAWLAVTTLALVVLSAMEDHAALRDFLVVGGATGFVFQAILGAWSFLLPSSRAPDPELRRRELVAMELGGRPQVLIYNLGLFVLLVGLRGSDEIAITGIILAWGAAAWAMVKSWTFPKLAALPLVRRRSQSWWVAPKG
jgi:nitrite reductase (NO-forming)